MLSPARFLQALGNVRREAQQTRHVSGAPFAIAAYWLAVRTPPLFQQQFHFIGDTTRSGRDRPTAWRSGSSSFKSNTVSSHGC